MLTRQWGEFEVSLYTAFMDATEWLTERLTKGLDKERLRCDRGQATAEYALVVLGAATVAMMLIAWATSTGKVSSLLNRVVDSIADRVS